MKKTILILVLFALSCIALTSCIIPPEEPKEIRPFCLGLYNTYEGLPRTFVGYCTASLRSERLIGYQDLCSYPAFWELWYDGTSWIDPWYGTINAIDFNSEQECLDYFNSLEVPSE